MKSTAVLAAAPAFFLLFAAGVEAALAPPLPSGGVATAAAPAAAVQVAVPLFFLGFRPLPFLSAAFGAVVLLLPLPKKLRIEGCQGFEPQKTEAWTNVREEASTGWGKAGLL